MNSSVVAEVGETKDLGDISVTKYFVRRHGKQIDAAEPVRDQAAQSRAIGNDARQRERERMLEAKRKAMEVRKEK